MAGDLVGRFPSGRHPGVVYEVRLEDGVYTCQCPGFVYRRECRHVAVLAELRALPVTALQPQAERVGPGLYRAPSSTSIFRRED